MEEKNGRLMFRLALGLMDFTHERVARVLEACSAVEPSIELEPTLAGAPIDLPHAALGLVSDAVGAAYKTPALARARLTRVAAAARRGAARLDRARNLVGRVPGASRALGRLGAWRDRGRRQLARWAEVGRRERAQSRLLTVDALTVLRENLLARVSESPELKEVIRQQSAGIAVTAMGELRERSARADNLAERTIGRLFHDGRSPRGR
jgi:hypothetical protein